MLSSKLKGINTQIIMGDFKEMTISEVKEVLLYPITRIFSGIFPSNGLAVIARSSQSTSIKGKALSSTQREQETTKEEADEVMEGEGEGEAGPVTCASWIRRSEKQLLVVMGRARNRSCPPLLDIFEFNPKTASLSPDPLVLFASSSSRLELSVHPSSIPR